MDVSGVLNYGWPGAWLTVFKVFKPGDDLQGFLDSQVEWAAGVIPPSAAEVLAMEPVFLAARAARMQSVADRKIDRAAIRGDIGLRALIARRPDQIDGYIEDNVRNLAEAKAVLKMLAKAVALLGREEIEDGS